MDAGVTDAPTGDTSDATVWCDPYEEACTCDEPGPPGAPTLPAPTVLVNLGGGEETLVDVLPLANGVAVVLYGEVRLMGRDGSALSRWTTTRTIASATVDGDRLIIGDGGALTILDSSLVPTGEIRLTEQCSGAARMPCERFLCASSRSVERVFYTYDLAGRVELARSSPQRHAGSPLVRVPGLEAFITVTTNLSPAGVHFYRLDGDRAVLVAESPYHSEFEFSDVLTFRGDPPTHVITHRGELFRLDGCSRAPLDSVGAPDCLTIDGILGTLHAEETYVGLDARGDRLAAIACRSNEPPDGGWTGCHLDRIDLARNVIESSRAAPLSPSPSGTRLRIDPWSGGVILATPRRCEEPYFGTCDGWEARLVPFE
jgi:hypothetical protein